MKMEKINSEKWVEATRDSNNLEILFYLKQFNPDVTVQDLEKNIGMEKEKIENKLEELEDLGIVEKSNSGFKLSERGRVMMNGIYADINEEPTFK